MNEKVGIVCYPGKSGLAHYSFSLCRGLYKIYPSLVFITNKELEFSDNELGCKVVRLFSKTRWIWWKYIQFLFYILRHRIKLIHFQSWVKYPIIDYFIVIFLKLMGVKIVFTAHDVLPIPYNAYEKFVCKKIYNLCDSVIVHSENSKKVFENLLKFSRANVFVIPHGLHDVFLPRTFISRNVAREKLSIASDSRVLLVFGGIGRQKEVVKLIDSIKDIRFKEPRIKLLIVGKNYYPNGFLENIIRKNALEKYIGIVKRWVDREEVHLYFTSADLVILPYLENYTSSILKLAYAFQIPVIVTDVGELADTIKQEQTGIVISKDFTEKDVSRIVNLLANNKIREDMTRNISKVAKNKYSWSIIAQQTMKIYNDLL